MEDGTEKARKKRKIVNKSDSLVYDSNSEGGGNSILDPRHWYRRAQILTDELYRKYKFQFEEGSPLWSEATDWERDQYLRMIKDARKLMGEVREYLKEWEGLAKELLPLWLNKRGFPSLELDELDSSLYEQMLSEVRRADQAKKLLSALSEISGRAMQIEGYHRKVMPFVKTQALNAEDLEIILWEEAEQEQQYLEYLKKLESKIQEEEQGV